MITPEKIDEWVREVEERPTSAPVIVRMIANRLARLTERNEELLAENIQLSSGAKVEDFEAQIAALTYQLDLLKRQLGGEAAPAGAGENPVDTLVAILYNSNGSILKVELDPEKWDPHGSLIGHFAHPETVPEEPGLLITGAQDELLLLFDTGRTQTLPVSALAACPGEGLDWGGGTQVEPHGAEHLALIASIGRLPLADAAIQVSRKGFVKRMMRANFETYLAKNFVGAGVKLARDQACGLLLGAREDVLALASQEGYLLALEANRLPFAIEGALRLESSDHLVSSFILGKKPLVVFVTTNGKVVNREASWVKTPAGDSLQSRGQAVFSAERRRAGTRLVGVAAVDPRDWCAALDAGGRLSVYSLEVLLGSGSIPASQEDREPRWVAFTAIPERARGAQ